MSQPNMGGGLGPSMSPQQPAHTANSSVGYAHHSHYGLSPMQQQSPPSSHPTQVSQYLTVGLPQAASGGQQRPPPQQHGVYMGQQQQHPGQLVAGHHQQTPPTSGHYIIGPGPVQQRPTMQQPQPPQQTMAHFQQQQSQQQMQRPQMSPYSTTGQQVLQQQQPNPMMQQAQQVVQMQQQHQQSPGQQQMMPPPQQQIRMPVSVAPPVMITQHTANQLMQQGALTAGQQQMIPPNSGQMQRLIAPGPPQGHFPRTVILPQQQPQQQPPQMVMQQPQQLHLLSTPQMNMGGGTPQVAHFALPHTSAPSSSSAAPPQPPVLAPPPPTFSASASASSSNEFGASEASTSAPQVLTKQRLDDLTKEVDPYEQLDEDVKDALLQYADDFIENLVGSACQIAKHRKSTTLDVKDVQLALERNWNMWIPGFGTDEIRPYKKSCVTEAHKQRMGLIKKTLKKI